MVQLPIKTHLINLARVKNPQEPRASFLRLDKNENAVGFDSELTEIFKKQITPEFLAIYPEIDSLYNKIAGHLGLQEENIYISAGSDSAIKAVFEVFINRGDKVALLHPTYAMFYVYVKMFEAEPVKIGYKEDLSLTENEVIEAISGCKLLCLANPNSPTSTVISPEGIRKILDFCLKENIVVLLDEAYYPYYPVSSVGLISEFPNLIVTRTFSKAMGLASCRLGFAAGQAEIISYLHKVRPMYEINAFAVKLGNLILDNYHLVEKHLQEINEAKAFLEKELDGLSLPHFKGYANFILIKSDSPEKAVLLKEELKKRKILVAAGFKEDPLKNCVRVSFGNLEQMRYFINNLKQVLYGK